MSLAERPQSDRTVVVTPTGDLDAATVDALRAEVTERWRAGAECVIVDLARVTFVDSRGLGALIVLRNDAIRAGRSFALGPGPPRVERVFALTGTRGLFDWA